jgi:hypothetical protein
MAARLLVLFFGVLLVVAVFGYGRYLTRDHDVITSTPSAYTGGIQPVPVAPHGSACVDQILFDTDTEVARFGATTPKGKPGPPLVIDATGQEPGGYSSRSFIAGGWTGTRLLDARLERPAHATLGTLCVTNRSGQQLTLLGRNDDRTRSRPLLHVDGQTNPDLELPVTLLEAERSSFLSRAGDIFAHAQALQPLGTWWWWLLAILLIVAVPAALALAIREATALDRVDEAVARPARAPAKPWPSERVRRRIEAVPGWAIVAVVALLAFLYFAYWGLHTHVFQDDEDQYVYLSRWLQLHFPESLWNFDVMQRGLQRLEVWLLAVPAAIIDSPGSLVAGRFLNTLSFVSTAIPVYLLGRGMGLRSRWAALPATLSIVVPWAVVTTAFLTENIAYPACLWVVWAVWRAATEPGPWRDALALVLLVVAGMSRTAMLLLIPLLPAVVLVTDLRYADGRIVDRLRASLRSHLVLWGAVVAAALVLLAGSVGIGGGLTTKLAGVYGTPFGFDAIDLLFKIGQFFSRAVVGTGFFAAAVALPWLALQIVRPAGRRDFTFALTVVGAGVIVLYMVHTASLDERYIVYLAPMLLLPATLAIARRELSAVGVGVASVLLAALLLRVKWNADGGDFGYFVSPAETFYGRGLAERLDLSVPGDRGTVLTLIPIALALAGGAVAYGLRSNPGRLTGRFGALVVAAVVLMVVVETQYTLSNYVNSAGSKAGAGLRARAFADEGTPAGAHIGEFIEGVGKSPDFAAIWQEVQFYNQRMDRVYSLGQNSNAVPSGDELVDNVGFDPDTGRVQASKPLPDYVVIPTPVGTARVRGQVLASPSYIPAALIKVAQPATMAWSTGGLDATGAVGPKGASVRFYGTGLSPGAHCATIDLGAPGSAPVRWTTRVVTASGRARRVGSGRVKPGARQRATVPLADLVERSHIDVVLGGGPRVLAIYVDQYC